jgi:hypothetical protein
MNVRKRFGLTFVIGALAMLGYARPASAQIGGGFSFLTNGETSTGFAVNAAKEMRHRGNIGLAPAGDFSIHFNDGHVTTFGGGLRANFHTMDTRFIPFGEVLLGVLNTGCDGCDGDTAFQITWGAGVHVPVSPKWNILAQFDIITAMRDAGTDNGFRMTFGISMPWH